MEIGTDNLHHAYLLVGSKDEGERYFESFLNSLGLKEAGNPDFHGYRVESFDIESAREVRDKAREKPFGEKKVFLISAERFTHQAQNALLKTFEEPSKDVHFFILLNAPDLLLPTLLSRMQVVRANSDFTKVLGSLRSTRHFENQNLLSHEDFLGLDLKGRLKFAEKFADSEDSLPVFLDSLMSKANPDNQKKIFTVRRFADDPSAQPRLILEHLALVL
jgi:hypothetical protein